MGGTRTIEVDARTADVLEARAAARGLTVADLVADLAWTSESLPPDLQAIQDGGTGPWAAAALAEDARRLEDFRRTREGVPWPEVKAWMQSWNAPNELPAPNIRKL